jgi:hypothetical protein
MAWDARKYRMYALECADMARKVRTPEEKTAFMSLAARWATLAQNVEVEQALLAQDDDGSVSDNCATGASLH